MASALWLALKDLRLLSRDPVALFWVLGFPLVFSLFLGGVLRAGLRGDQAPLEVVVVPHGAGPRPAADELFLSALRQQERLSVRTASLDVARQRVRRGEAVAYVELLKERSVRLGIDPSRSLEAAFVRQVVAAVYARITPQEAAPSPADIETVSVSPPRDGKFREAEYVYPAAVLWALIGCAACFAISMVTERTQGTLLRLMAAPLEKSAVLGGKALACLLSCLTVTLALSVVGFVAFGLRFERPLAVAVALLSGTFCFVGITMLLSLLGRTEQSVAGAGWAVLILMAMLGGGMVPLSLMPDWLLAVSHLSPAKWCMLALEGATWRRFSAAELATPCGILLGIAVAGFGAGASVFARVRA